MADIFDTLDAPSGDIFDQISVPQTPKQGLAQAGIDTNIPTPPEDGFTQPEYPKSTLDFGSEAQKKEAATIKREYVSKPMQSIKASAGQAASMLAFPVASIADNIQGGDINKDALAKSIDEFTRQKRAAAPDESVGPVGHFVRGVEEVAPLLATGPLGVPTIAAEATTGTAVDLINKGVSPKVASSLGALSGVAATALTSIPFTGKNVIQNLVRGATVSPAIGMINRAAQKGVLSANDYDKLANEIKVADPNATAQDVAMGIMFGLHGSMGKPLVGESVADTAIPFADVVKQSNWYRRLTIKERGLVAESLDQAINRTGKSEAELVRMSDAYKAEAIQRRQQGEKNTDTLDDILSDGQQKQQGLAAEVNRNYLPEVKPYAERVNGELIDETPTDAIPLQQGTQRLRLTPTPNIVTEKGTVIPATKLNEIRNTKPGMTEHQIEESKLILDDKGEPFLKKRNAEFILFSKGLKKTHEIVKVGDGYAIQPKGATWGQENGTEKQNREVRQEVTWKSKDKEIDPRINEQPIRENLQTFLDSESVVQTGNDRPGKTFVDNDGNVLGKIPSANPEWVQDAIKAAGGLDKLKSYVRKAVAGEKLGAKAKDGGYSQREAVKMVIDEYVNQRDNAFEDKELAARDTQETLPAVDSTVYPEDWTEETKKLSGYVTDAEQYLDKDTVIGILEKDKPNSEIVKELVQRTEEAKNGQRSEENSQVDAGTPGQKPETDTSQPTETTKPTEEVDKFSGYRKEEKRGNTRYTKSDGNITHTVVVGPDGEIKRDDVEERIDGVFPEGFDKEGEPNTLVITTNNLKNGKKDVVLEYANPDGEKVKQNIGIGGLTTKQQILNFLSDHMFVEETGNETVTPKRQQNDAALTDKTEAGDQTKLFATPSTFGTKTPKGKAATNEDMHFNDLQEADKQGDMFAPDKPASKNVVEPKTETVSDKNAALPSAETETAPSTGEASFTIENIPEDMEFTTETIDEDGTILETPINAREVYKQLTEQKNKLQHMLENCL